MGNMGGMVLVVGTRAVGRCGDADGAHICLGQRPGGVLPADDPPRSRAPPPLRPPSARASLPPPLDMGVR